MTTKTNYNQQQRKQAIQEAKTLLEKLKNGEFELESHGWNKILPENGQDRYRFVFIVRIPE